MEIEDLISPEVIQKVKDALDRFEHWAAYNNTLLFVHETDIQFFTNQEDAASFAEDNVSDFDRWNIVRIDGLNDFIAKVEAAMPGVAYKPPQQVPVVQEIPASYFPKEKLLQNRKIMVNEQNEKYLKNQLDFLGFSERLHSQLEEKMREGKPEFTLQDTGQFNDDKMEAVIHFRFSEKDGKEAYFCNHYIATLLREEQNRSQFIYVNSKGQSITFKESCNLLNHRCVFKQITPREGAAKQNTQGESTAKDNNPYWAWLRVDPNNIDPKTGYPKLRQFTEKYGFNLKEAVERVKFKGMEYDDYTKGIMKSLRKGNLVGATLITDGREIPVTIEANPQMRTLNMYDKHGEKMFYPMQKVETKYGQAPADAKRNDRNPANETGKDLSKSNGQIAGAQGSQEHAGMLNEPGVKYERKNLLDKKPQGNGLLEKNKNRSRSRSKKLS